MADILEEIVAWKRLEVEQRKEAVPQRALYEAVERMMDDGMPQRSMRRALTESATGIIAEFKRKSPSKGWIKEEGRAEDIPASYACHGAAALSILTDEKFFGGSPHYIRTARPLVEVPILRKDFIIDEYQLFEARHIGADAVLLIAADLRRDECRTLIHTAHEIGLEVLLELHDEAELDYADLDADMLGVNNRHLGTFVTDVAQSFHLAARLPHDRVLVSESGIGSPDTILRLRQVGFRGFLMGEHFMRAKNPGEALAKFIGSLSPNPSPIEKGVKVCGMREGENIRAVEALNPQWMGFICWEGSARCVSGIPTYLPQTCKRVGVFVNPKTGYVRQRTDELHLQCLQLHGQETPEQCTALHRLTDLPVIKAIPVATAEDIARARTYNNVEGVEMLLFDTRSDVAGGSGRHFDWTLLQTYDGDTPFLLSGGIGPQDAARIKKLRHPRMAGIDLNSRFETAPGVKDIDTLREFIDEIRKA